ncbi:hypothetical protein SAMN04487995_6030 [Dyadobacter koreensis]|uniref:Uncharacterized protein n=1 Tax=Dyadobacter koreensis TaxID=408657 RepID=A0A1H7AZL1_9BACT|nr:hypothetical protein SAMN04487995_6030 [Dyadobacter koreensis]
MSNTLIIRTTLSKVIICVQEKKFIYSDFIRKERYCFDNLRFKIRFDFYFTFAQTYVYRNKSLADYLKY